MSASLKSTLLAFAALERGPRRYAPEPAANDVDPYRGAPALPGGAVDGTEWLRRAELIAAGQRDLFGDAE